MNTTYFGGELNARDANAVRRLGKSLEAQEAAYFAQFSRTKLRFFPPAPLFSAILGLGVGLLAFGAMLH